MAGKGGQISSLLHIIIIIGLCVDGSSCAQLVPKSVTVAGKLADLSGDKDTPLILGIRPNEGPLLDKYGVVIELQNIGSPVVLTNVDVGVYSGLYKSEIPANASSLAIDKATINQNLPTLEKGEKWPGEGLKFGILASSIPETIGCAPFDLTINVTAAYTLDGRQEEENNLVPLQISPNCLSDNFSDVFSEEQGSNSSLVPPKVSIQFASDYVQTTNPQMGFYVNFGARVLEGEPSNLITVNGTSRFDMLYAWETGEIFIVAYPEDDDRDATISVSVRAGITAYDTGYSNAGAELTVQYKPGNGAYKDAGIVLTAVFAAIILSSWLTSFIVSSVQPWATAGSLGYGALGMILWAQKFYLSGMISTEVMPANYRTMTDVFAWANLQAPLPWNWGSGTSGLPENITEGNGIYFQKGTILILNAKDLSYSGFTTDTSISLPPPVQLSPPTPMSPTPVEGAATPVLSPVPPPIIPAPPVLPTIPTESCSNLENTDFFGGDLKTGGVPAANPQQCCDSCLSDADCAVWTFSRVDNRCYIKGKIGWQTFRDRTCCVSGITSRNGVPSVTLQKVPEVDVGNNVADDKNNDKNNGNKNNNNNGNKNKNNNGKNRRLMKARALLQEIQDVVTSAVAPDNVRLRAISYNDPFSNTTSASGKIISGQIAGERAKYLIEISADTNSESIDYYDGIERAAFWFGCLLAAALLVNTVSYLLVKCCEGEVPGVLYLPRMILMSMLISLCGFSFASAELFSNGGGLGPVIIGILVVVFYPVLFLVSSAIGIVTTLYRRRKAVYLLSSNSNTEDFEISKWDKKVISSWMGMSLNRGKWRPTDPSKKNEFVFRWGALFEDCRGPLYQRKKLESSSSASLKRTGSIVSDHSSQSGANTVSESGMMPRKSSSRKKVTSVEEKPMCNCCGRGWRRSNYQAYGTIISFSRMSIYGLLIGSLHSWPVAQAGSCLGVSILYLLYLRFSVPFSRRDEMALEYWISLVDISIFGVLLGLTLGVGPEDFSGMETYCITLIVLQGIALLSYLINRVLIIIHAFAEVVCPACQGPPKKRRRRHRSSGKYGSNAYGTSETSESQIYSANGDTASQLENGLTSEQGDSLGIDSEAYVAPRQPQTMSGDGRTPSRSSRHGSFPAIVEEPTSGSRQNIGNVEDRDEINLSQGHGTSRKGQNAVFDKFWRSL